MTSKNSDPFLLDVVRPELCLLSRVEFKNLGGGKHQLIIKKAEITDDGEIKVALKELVSTCYLKVSILNFCTLYLDKIQTSLILLRSVKVNMRPLFSSKTTLLDHATSHSVSMSPTKVTNQNFIVQQS